MRCDGDEHVRRQREQRELNVFRVTIANVHRATLQMDICVREHGTERLQYGRRVCALSGKRPRLWSASAPRSVRWRRYSLASRRGPTTGSRCTSACTAHRLLTHDISRVSYTPQDILHVRDVTRRPCPFPSHITILSHRRSSERYSCRTRQGIRRGYIRDSRERGSSGRSQAEQQPPVACCTSFFLFRVGRHELCDLPGAS